MQNAKHNSRIDLVLLSAIIGFLGGLLGTLVSELFIMPRNEVREVPAFTRGGERGVFALDDMYLRVGRGVVQWYGAKTAQTKPESLRAAQAVAFGLVVTSDGWLLAPSGVGSGHIPVVDRRVLKVERVVRDPWTGFAFVKTDGRDLTVSAWAEEPPRAGTYLFAPTRERGLTTHILESVRGTPIVGEAYGSAMVLSGEGATLVLGAPLFDREGRVVGMYASSRAIPARHIIGAQNAVLKLGRAVRPDAGFETQDMSLFPVPAHPRGALVVSVRPQGPGDRAGIQVRDIVLGVNNEPVDAQNDLFERLAGYDPGKEIRLEILRSGSKMTLLLTLGEAKS